MNARIWLAERSKNTNPPLDSKVFKRWITEEYDTSLSERTCSRYMRKLGWVYKSKIKGIYVDGHQRPDVIEYRKKFVNDWKMHLKNTTIYKYEGYNIKIYILQI